MTSRSKRRARYSCAGLITSAGLVLILALSHGALPAFAQELEPRAYANTPIGMNFLLAGYGYSDGSLLFDPSVPIQGASASVNMGVLGYAHAFAMAGKSAKFGLVLPYAGLDANGYVEGNYHERKVSGFADPSVLLSVNFFGAPALALPEFRGYRQDTIIGASLKVTAPLGQYDDDRLLNIGTNRWSFKPELGISQAIGDWIVEGAAAVSLYTANDDFFGGQRLEQAPIFSGQGHVVYSFTEGLWAAADATYFTGGATTIGGVRRDNKLDNWRFGLTLTLPIDRYNSLKFAGSSGVSTRTGTDYDAYLLAWQHRWGGGF